VKPGRRYCRALVGVLSLADFARAEGSGRNLAAAVIREVSGPLRAEKKFALGDPAGYSFRRSPSSTLYAAVSPHIAAPRAA
jgi:hypothetical protein